MHGYIIYGRQYLFVTLKTQVTNRAVLGCYRKWHVRLHRGRTAETRGRILGKISWIVHELSQRKESYLPADHMAFVTHPRSVVLLAPRKMSGRHRGGMNFKWETCPPSAYIDWKWNETSTEVPRKYGQKYIMAKFLFGLGGTWGRGAWAASERFDGETWGQHTITEVPGGPIEAHLETKSAGEPVMNMNIHECLLVNHPWNDEWSKNQFHLHRGRTVEDGRRMAEQICGRTNSVGRECCCWISSTI